jgi:hypothetical protein
MYVLEVRLATLQTESPAEGIQGMMENSAIKRPERKM